jgi:histidinol phosphatase-like PHP family hydrolase
VLSAHKDVYADDPASVTDATIAAIERYHEKIFCIGHPCNAWDFGDSYDIKRLATVANKYNIPLEVNAKNLLREKTNLTQLDTMIKTADTLCLNSDAHTLYELQESRTFAKKYLTDKGYI